jgi:uncharacterized spore protein YtfJ
LEVNYMEIVESLVKTTLGEIEKVLNSKTVVGEPLAINGKTIIPLVSVGFGFGAGGGSGRGESKQKGEGTGGGTGGGAWVRPVAVIIIDQQEVRIEPIMGSLSGAIEKIGETIPNLLGKALDKWSERKKQEED